MKITAVSDLHGNLIEIEPCDVLLICGDISPVNIQRDYIQMWKWFFSNFYNWIMNLPCDRVIITPGNHDFFFETFFTDITKMNLWDKLTILIHDEEYLYYDDKWFKIFATPYCKTFGKWPYMPGDTKLEELYKEIPEDLDILMTHDAPLIGYVGNIMEDITYTNGRPAGNKWLADRLLEMKKRPKYIFCGHIHSGKHELEEIEDMQLANVSLLDEAYDINYKPLTIEL